MGARRIHGAAGIRELFDEAHCLTWVKLVATQNNDKSNTKGLWSQITVTNTVTMRKLTYCGAEEQSMIQKHKSGNVVGKVAPRDVLDTEMPRRKDEKLRYLRA